MYNPQTKGTKDYTESIDEFRGLDLNERISSGFLAWTRNCSSRRYPTLSARYERGLVGDYGIDCMIALDGNLYFVDQQALYRLPHADEEPPTPGKVFCCWLNPDVTTNRLVSMGVYIIAFPDYWWYNTLTGADGEIYSEWGDPEMSETVSYSMCNSQGDGIDAHAAKGDPYTLDPDDPDYDSDAHSDGYYWIDTSDVPHVLKRWSAIYEDWTQIPNTFTKISALDIDDNFEEMDSITISGSTVIENGSYTIYHKGTDYIVVPFLLDAVATVSEPLYIQRTIPLMDFVVECDNRLWGCRYGRNLMGETVNEIYASALGDFKNWYRFLGLSTDSYVASRGCDGEWTGAVAYLDMVVFFKADHIEIVHPSDTGAHRIETLHVNGTGVAPRSGQSVVVVDNVVYYHGLFGFYAFTGNVPQKISAQLGENVYSDAVAGELNGVYYVCVTDTLTNERHLFTYDTKRGIWYREDEIDIRCFARNGNELYFCEADEDGGGDEVIEI